MANIRRTTNEEWKKYDQRRIERYAETLPMPAFEPLKSEPWFRWPQETPTQYEAFAIYRDMLPKLRSLSRVVYVRRNGQPPEGMTPDQVSRKANPTSTVSVWARHYRWKDRVDAFDRANERRRLEEMHKGTMEAYREMGERHAREAVALQAKAVERLRSLDPNELSAAEVRQFIVAAATLERLSRGASLQDMATAQREATVEGRAQVTAQIEYVDDWRGDRARLERLKQQNSYYGSGQGLLPQDLEGDGGVTPVRSNGQVADREWLDGQLSGGEDPLPVPEAPRRPDPSPPGP